MNLTSRLPLIKRREGSKDTINSVYSGISLSFFTPRAQKEFPIKFLRPSREKRGGSMEAYNGPIGNEAKLEFYETFKNLPMFTERNRTQKLEDTPTIAYLNQVHKNNLNPEPFGIIRRKGPDTLIDIHQYSMGDSYAEAFSIGVCAVKDVETVNLKGNRLSDLGAATILNRLASKNIKRIILSDNKLGTQSINCICHILTGLESSIKILELENTQLSEKSIKNLCMILSENKTLARLSLARNNISGSSANALKEMLKYNHTLKYLDLH